MRTRASRIVLVVAGALPLLAEDGHSTAEPDIVEQQMRNASLWEATQDAFGNGPIAGFDVDDENDDLEGFVEAAEALHDDSLSNFPSLREHEAVEGFSTESNTSLQKTADCTKSQGRPDCIDYAQSEELDYLEYPVPTDFSDSAGSDEQQALISVEDISKETLGEGPAALEIADDQEPDVPVTSQEVKAVEEHETEGTTTADSESGQDQHVMEGTSEDASIEEQEVVEAPVVEEKTQAHETRMEQLVVDYASKSAGALILEKSPNFQGTSNLLNRDRDKYAMTPCSEKKFAVISLSEDIQVKQVKLANFELYSSRVKEFQILGSQTTGDWVDLGTCEAKPSADIQSIDLIEPSWARYLMFRFLTHYGDEHYCTISQIMVHGSTMIQGFHEHWENEDSVQEDDKPDAVATHPTESDDIGRGSGEPKTLQDRQPVEHDTSEPKAPGTVDAMIQPSDEDQRASSTGDVSHSSESSTATGGRPDVLKTEKSEGSLDYNEPSPGNMWPTVDDAPVEGSSTKSALLSASISLSSTVLSTFIGHLDPLSLPSLRGLLPMYGKNLDSPLTLTDHVHGAVPNRVGRLHYESSYPSMDPALVQFLTDQSRALSPVIPLAEGEKSVGQSLTEKLVSNLNEERQRHAELTEEAIVEKPVGLKVVEGDHSTIKAEADNIGSVPPEETLGEKTATYEDLHDTDLALERMLQSIPSAECLKELDYTQFKARIIAAKKGAAGVAGHPQTAYSMEPIFKKLTDEIKALQLGLSVHDQFTKASVACYQRVLLDVIIELQTLNMDHELRLARLEQDLSQASTVRWAVQIHHFVTGFIETCSNFNSRVMLPLQKTVLNKFAIGNQDGRFFISRVALTAVMIVALALCQLLIPTVLFNIVQLWKERRRREGSRRLSKIQKGDCRLQVPCCVDVVSKKDKLDSSHVVHVEGCGQRKVENAKETRNSTISNQNDEVPGKGMTHNQNQKVSGNSTIGNPTTVVDSELIVKELGGILSTPGTPLNPGGSMRSRGQ